MQIKSVKVKNFRNYIEQEINLNKDVNILYGDNGQGKTNILEAIFLCSMGKSFRTSRDQELIKIGENFAEIEIFYQKKDREGTIRIILENKKLIFINGVKINKLSDLLGKINVVIFTPDDLEILKQGPNKRRRFLDMMIGQLRPNYIYQLNLYLKTLEQRNNYLRQIKFENKDENMLDIWDEKLAEYAEKIANYRFEFIQKIKEKINVIHKRITNCGEFLEINYLTESINKKEILEIFKKSRKIDILKGYTTKGIHRDDFTVSINDKPVNIYGSQGQHRTVILSLKLTELKIISEEIGEEPILLLDDFMSELDEKRRKNLLENIQETQVIISCTDKMEIEKARFFYIKNGETFQN